MKNIFKKNSIIITALAIMIVIAGYLSFTNKDTKDNAGSLADKASVEDSDVTAVDGTDVVTDTTGTNKDATATDNTTTNKEGTTTDANKDNNTATDLTKTPKDKTTNSTTTDELGDSDISDDDVLANAKDVSDNGELNLKDGTPGEAVLASTTLDSGFFVSKRLEREQKRAKDTATYMDIIESAKAPAQAKEKATDGITELTKISDKEDAAELLLEAKGFDDAIVFMTGDKAEVVVNSDGLSKQQLAIIEDVVKNETNIPVKNINIIPVVVSE